MENQLENAALPSCQDKADVPTHKLCRNVDCLNKEEQPITNFHKNKATKDGFSYYCKNCVKTRYRDPNRREQKVIPEAIVQEARKLFISNPSMSVDMICKQFGYNLISALYNLTHKDENYQPPKRKKGRK
jgi:hypothetical protein